MYIHIIASTIAQQVNNLPEMQEMGSIPGAGRSPGGGNGNPLNPWTEEPGGLQSLGS